MAQNPDNNRSIKRQIRREASHVRTVLMDWAAIPENPDDEYDCLVDHIVSALHRGADVSALAELIEVGFQDHFGLPVDREAAVSVAQTIGHWWERNRAS